MLTRGLTLTRTISVLRFCATPAAVRFAVAAFALGWSVAAVANPHIEWEVYNRFRFYKNPEIFRHYLEVATSTAKTDADNWILRTEDALQEHSDKKGWAAQNLAPDDMCWNRLTWSYDRCGTSADYLNPKSVTILAQVADLANATKFTCEWTLDGSSSAPLKVSGPCSGTKFDIPFSPDGTPVRSLAVVAPGGPTVAPTPVSARDYLVVGMGDSFGAGVGNPDLPAQMSDGPQQKMTFRRGPIDPDSGQLSPDPKRAYLPSRDAPADWLDMRCFRSQYGPQFRAALHLAAALPHVSVTFLDFSCSGATVLQGLLGPKPIDAGFAASVGAVPAQLGAVAALVCRQTPHAFSRVVVGLSSFDAEACRRDDRICVYHDSSSELPPNVSLHGCGQSDALRQIDYVLLSIGGNDIGFAQLVAYEAVRADTLDTFVSRALAKHFGNLEKPAEADAKLSYLRGLYYHLNAALELLLPLRDGDLSRVLLANYPMPDGWSDTTLCGSDNASSKQADRTMDGEDFFGGFADVSNPKKKAAVVTQVHQAVCQLELQRTQWMNGSLDPKQKRSEAWIASVPCKDRPANDIASLPRLPWSYVSGFVENAWKHGFCAGAEQMKEACGNDSTSADCIAERAEIPGFAVGSTGPSNPYDVGKFRPYQERQRWFRTFNDAYLTTNWWDTPGLRNLDNAVSTFTTGAMHPTAEGYAAVADSLLRSVGADLCKRGQIGRDSDAVVDLCSP